MVEISVRSDTTDSLEALILPKGVEGKAELNGSATSAVAAGGVGSCKVSGVLAKASS